MYCSKCGKEITDEVAFCPYCGASLNANANTNVSVSQYKSKLAAGLLAILLGLGIHNFYLGYTGKGVAQLLLSFCGVGYIWCLIEGIMILTGSINTDAAGNPLKD